MNHLYIEIQVQTNKVCKSCLTEGVLNFKTDNIYFVLLQGPASSALTKINMQLLAYWDLGSHVSEYENDILLGYCTV
jgi:hypothetical protein